MKLTITFELPKVFTEEEQEAIKEAIQSAALAFKYNQATSAA